MRQLRVIMTQVDDEAPDVTTGGKEEVRFGSGADELKVVLVEIRRFISAESARIVDRSLVRSG